MGVYFRHGQSKLSSALASHSTVVGTKSELLFFFKYVHGKKLQNAAIFRF